MPKITLDKPMKFGRKHGIPDEIKKVAREEGVDIPIASLDEATFGNCNIPDVRFKTTNRGREIAEEKTKQVKRQ